MMSEMNFISVYYISSIKKVIRRRIIRRENKDFGFCSNKINLRGSIERSHINYALEPEKMGFKKEISDLNIKSEVFFMGKGNLELKDKLNLFAKAKKADLRGYNCEWNRIVKNYPHNPIYIKLLGYSALVVEGYIKKHNEITTNNFKKRSKVQTTFDNDGDICYRDYLVKDDPNFDVILNSRAQYGYAAIVYMLKSELQPYKNLVYIGFSTLTVKERVIKHILAAIAPHGYSPECRYVNYVKLHRAIINVFEHSGIDVDAEYCWLKSNKGSKAYEERMEHLFQIVNEHFEIETIEIHKRKKTARIKENYYTKNYNNDNGSVGTVENGLNEIQGGSNGQYIELPLIDIVAMISLGVKPKKIHKLIENLYSIDVSYPTFSERIRIIWRGHSKVLEIFLKPVVESLIKDDNDFKFNEICKAVNRDRSVLRKYLKIWYKGRIFPILKSMKKQGNLDWSNLPLYIKDKRPELRGISLKLWDRWAMEGVSCKEIGEWLGLSEETIRQTYKRIPELGDKQKYCDRRRRETIREFLPKGWDPKDIMFEKFNLKPKDNYSMSKFYKRLFKGMNFEEIIQKGKIGDL